MNLDHRGSKKTENRVELAASFIGSFIAISLMVTIGLLSLAGAIRAAQYLRTFFN